MMSHYTLGLDFGTNSVRALIVDTCDGHEVGVGVYAYPHGEAGILLDPNDPFVARQHPDDYMRGTEQAVESALAMARTEGEFAPENVIGIGVDTTGSTPIPVDAEGTPLGLQPEFAERLEAMAWLWKDHTAHAEAAEITARAGAMRPQYLAKCGGIYSSEWFWSKLLHCARTAPDVFGAAHSWVEHCDWLPAVLTGTTHPAALKRGICAAGHKAMFHTAWGGYPDEEFLGGLHLELARVRRTLPNETATIAQSAGTLTEAWGRRLGLPTGIPVAVGAFDAHLGGVGSGIGPGTLVKIIGTSTCDMLVAPLDTELPDIPGLCGIVPESILPGNYGLEAGQSAVGDIFIWFVQVIRPGGGLDHAILTAEAEQLAPGESGLLALDWMNGNRTVLVDQRLTGMILGLTLHSRPAEIFRALVEATAFGARVILERFEEYGLKIERIVNCGGISVKNAMVMQIYADVMGRPLQTSSSAQTCALGAAMCGAVVAGAAAGGHADFTGAALAMTRLHERVFMPRPESQQVYDRLFALYRNVHDAFGLAGARVPMDSVMKDLLAIREAAGTR